MAHGSSFIVHRSLLVAGWAVVLGYLARVAPMYFGEEREEKRGKGRGEREEGEKGWPVCDGGGGRGARACGSGRAAVETVQLVQEPSWQQS